ncbi:ATP-binding protein [Salinibacterium sp.]|uniref:ATP-binding protein n=1 Tax=Salinibacterium sp. TaxID=1915057 RepID=UPI00286C3510|nr:ATP-binding protein [Salinibacterium sp.]
MSDLRVNISPGVSMLAVLSRLNYKPWFALAEYVDNSLQSMLANRDALIARHGAGYRLRIDIEIDAAGSGAITIRDNAAGIGLSDFPRAFRAAQIPPDRSGLSEFGMGMKSASCWFAGRWSVRTSALGANSGHIVTFNIEDIVHAEVDELEVFAFESTPESHFTEVRLWNLNHKPVGRTLGKVKQHLRDIYRVFIRQGSLDLRVNGESLEYDEPNILVAPFYKEPEDAQLMWRKEVEFDFGGGLKVQGFAALREKGDTQNSGFSLFRRGRVIEGSGDEGYRPTSVFGAGNSFRSQRLFGELHLDGFEVSHTKDGFQWDSNEEPFLDLLREALDSEPLPLLKQAEGHRAKTPSPDHAKIATEAISNAVETLETHLPAAIAELGALQPVEAPNEISDVPESVERAFGFFHEGQHWSFRIEISREDGDSHWMWHSVDTSGAGKQSIHIRLNMAHPFLLRFAANGVESLEAILRLAIAIVVGEVLAGASGVNMPGTVTRNIGKVLTSALSQP